MITEKIKVKNKLGLHARPAAMIVTTATKFKAEFFITKNGMRINGKSIMGVMMLAAEMGAELTLELDGPDEVEALKAIIEVIDTKFGESD